MNNRILDRQFGGQKGAQKSCLLFNFPYSMRIFPGRCPAQLVLWYMNQVQLTLTFLVRRTRDSSAMASRIFVLGLNVHIDFGDFDRQYNDMRKLATPYNLNTI